MKLGLTTNALGLHRHLDGLIDAGLTSLNISLDTFDPERFRQIARRDHFDTVWRNIHLALERGLRVKVNMVVMRGVNDDEVLRFVELTRPSGARALYRVHALRGQQVGRERVYTHGEMLGHIGVHSFTKLEDDPHSTAKAYRVDGWPGTFAVISTVTEPFLRHVRPPAALTAEGRCATASSPARRPTCSPLRNGEDVARRSRPTCWANMMLGGLLRSNRKRRSRC